MQGETSSITSESVLKDDDLDGDDDASGMETGGWYCFTKGLPIIHLLMW
jgi:hypothetical protein